MTPLPFVTCICPTRNRRLFLRRALEYYRHAARLYEVAGGRAEIVVVDSSDRPACYLGLATPDDRYLYLGPSFAPNCGEARNAACEVARGDIVLHWDDDDWQSEDRICRQVRTLLTVPGGLTTSSNFYWYHLATGQACRSGTWGAGGGSIGSAGAYWREAWKRRPFAAGVGEDVRFLRDHVELGTPLVDSMDPDLFIYIRHSVNISPATPRADDEATAKVRALMGPDVTFYDELAELLPTNPPSAPRVQVGTPLERAYMRHFR